GGAALNLFTLRAGMHTIVVAATDGLGNASSTTVTFEVHATVQGLLGALAYGATNKLIGNQFQSTLTSVLQSAQSALNAGSVAGAKSYLNSFVTQVQQASSAKIDLAFAALLVNWALDLIARL